MNLRRHKYFRNVVIEFMTSLKMIYDILNSIYDAANVQGVIIKKLAHACYRKKQP